MKLKDIIAHLEQLPRTPKGDSLIRDYKERLARDEEPSDEE